MAWRCPGDKPLSEPKMVSLPTHICVTRPQWVKPRYPCANETRLQCVCKRVKSCLYRSVNFTILFIQQLKKFASLYGWIYNCKHFITWFLTFQDHRQITYFLDNTRWILHIIYLQLNNIYNSISWFKSGATSFNTPMCRHHVLAFNC